MHSYGREFAARCRESRVFCANRRGNPSFTPGEAAAHRFGKRYQKPVESLGFDPSKIQDIYVTVSLEEGEGAKLLPFATTNGLPDPDPEVKLEADNLRIPINPTEFLTAPDWQAIIIHTLPRSKAPADPPCGSSGGSGYCDF
jgi:hypothetical protein